jgi:7-cyano-7-deazaguanine synthase in queuosine biosynthesis
MIKKFQKARDTGIIGDKTNLEYYMPFRNLTFASICGMIGELMALYEEYDEVLIGLGVHLHSEGNYSKNYWDITPEFVNKLNAVMELNDSLTFGVFAPYKDGFKDQIVKDAKTLDVPYQLTWTCYNPKKEVTEFLDNNIEVTATPCLECESCKERESMGSLVLADVNEYSITYKVEA